MSSQGPTQVHGEGTHSQVHELRRLDPHMQNACCDIHDGCRCTGAINTHTSTCRLVAAGGHLCTDLNLHIPMDSFPVAHRRAHSDTHISPSLIEFFSSSCALLDSSCLLLSLCAPPPALFLRGPDPHVTLFSCHPCLCLFPACSHRPALQASWGLLSGPQISQPLAGPRPFIPAHRPALLDLGLKGRPHFITSLNPCSAQGPQIWAKEVGLCPEQQPQRALWPPQPPASPLM